MSRTHKTKCHEFNLQQRRLLDYVALTLYLGTLVLTATEESCYRLKIAKYMLVEISYTRGKNPKSLLSQI